MKNGFTLFLLTVLFATGINLNIFSANPQLISNRLTEQIETSRDGELIKINIIMREKFDTYNLLRNVEDMEKEQRRSYVISVLKEFASLSQRGILENLNMLQLTDQVSDVNALWIINVINCYATPTAIYKLAERADIELIDHDFYQIILDPSENKEAYFEEGNVNNREITWNVNKVNAPQVWALGYDGEGVIVALIDTGVNYNHNDLKDHVWVHPDFPYHGYNFANNNNNPMDDNGHGTHCAGTVAGDGSSGSQTGVAPAATIMCLKVLDSSGGGQQSSIWSATEFAVEHGAHVLSLSLGWLHAWGPNRQLFRQAFDNVLAAGVVSSVAAGNEGEQQGLYPVPDNIRTPGDCPPPWLHPDQTLTGELSSVICVGATNSGDGVAGFSGRGPCTWQSVSPYNDYPYPSDIGLIRPDISAPGVNIKSLAHYSNTGYESGWEGTSMATPCAAGIMALMLHKNPLLTPAQISQILEETTVVLQPGKNNNSGSGRVNALAAIEATPGPGPAYYSHSINDETGNNNGQLDPGESVKLTVAMANFSEMVVDSVTVNISTQSPYVTITDGTEEYGNFDLNSIIEIEDAFAFDVANDVPGGEAIKFFLLAENDYDSWESSFTITANGVTITSSNFSINDFSGNGNGNLDPGENADILIQINNLGQITAPNVICTLTSTSSDITINNGSFTIPVIEPGQSSQANFSVSVSPTAQIGSIAEFNLEVVTGYYQYDFSFFPKIGLIVEDFETGDFTQFPWMFAGNQPWTVTNTGAYQGVYCAKSGTINNNASSEMKITIEASGGDSIVFYRKVSSEANYDHLRFYIDNTKVGEWSGETAWGRVAFPVTAGTKTFRWVYIKDIFFSSGQDCAWVDYIEFPSVVDNSLAVNAGADATICEGTSHQLDATAQNYTSLLWSTSGTGTFSDSTILNPIYTPSEADINAGAITLSLTVYNEGGESLTDNLILNFLLLPSTPEAITGLSQVCMGENETYSINQVANAEYYNWILTPANAGSFAGNGTEIVISFSNNYTGAASLKVCGINNCGIGNFSEEFNILVEDCTGINELDTSGKFFITPNPNDGSFMIHLNDNISRTNILKLMNTKGQVILQLQLEDSDQIQMNTKSLENGMYFIMIENEQSVSIQKLIINK